MRPRTVAVWVLAAVAIVLLTNNPVYRALVALVALNFVLARRRPGLSLRGLPKLLGVFALVTVVYNPLISHAGAHRVFEIPGWLPGIGGAVTVESFMYGISAAVGFTAIALTVAPLLLVLDATDLLEALPSSLQGTGTALSAALNLVPTVARSFVKVREAEALRGGGAGRGARAFLATIVPVALTTIESSITLAEAMEARAYGSGPRTSYRGQPYASGDLIVVGAAILGACTMLALRVRGVDLDWYPFPAATLPRVSLLAVGACLLLAVPLFLRPRRLRVEPVAAPA